MYNRTQNDNGTFNTRCLHCFMTVASAVESPAALDAVEAVHKCPERVLAELVACAAPPAKPLLGRQPH